MGDNDACRLAQDFFTAGVIAVIVGVDHELRYGQSGSMTLARIAAVNGQN